MRLVSLAFLVLAIARTGAAQEKPDVLDALAATADDDGRIDAAIAVTSVAPLGNGLALIDATWQGQPLVGLATAGLRAGRGHMAGAVVASGDTLAFAGVADLTDGTSNTVIFMAPGHRLGGSTQTRYTFNDVLIKSLALHPDGSAQLLTTVTGAPFAAAAITAPPVPLATTFTARGAVLQTPLGPVGLVNASIASISLREPPRIIGILIGL
jgi:hypothetical protein